MIFPDQWDDTKNCMSHSWYLAIDMQFFIISPFIIFTMWKFPKVGSIFAGLLTLIGKSQLLVHNTVIHADHHQSLLSP